MFTWLMLGGFILLLLPHNLTGKIQLGFVRVFRWPLSVGGGFALSAKTEQPLRDAVPRRQYNKLLIHSNNLEATLSQERERFKQLYGLYNASVWEDKDFALAEVITATHNELTIDYKRGARLMKDQFVLGDNSIVGKISNASVGTAHVRLFTDPKSAIPVKIGDLDIKMVMIGNGDGSARIPLMETKYKVEVGDNVYASDAGTRFLDAPVIIGTVKRCVESRKYPLIWDITVKPACVIANLEGVAVIIMKPQQ